MDRDSALQAAHDSTVQQTQQLIDEVRCVQLSALQKVEPSTALR
jgi:hypothetical protein